MARERVYLIKGKRPVPVISGMPVLSEIIAPENCYRHTTGTATVTSPDESIDEEAIAAARQYLLDARCRGARNNARNRRFLQRIM
jgi:hypothetical protein